MPTKECKAKSSITTHAVPNASQLLTVAKHLPNI